MSKIKRYTPAELAFVKNNFRKLGNKEISDRIGRSADSVSNKLKEKEWKRSREELAAIRRRTTAATQFKPGQRVHNEKYDGYERLSKDGYIEVRVKKGKFVSKHRLLWEKNHGPIPKGFNVVFKDGDRSNIKLDNLEMISDAALCLRNDNPEAKSRSLKKAWSRAFTLNQIGIKRSWYKKGIQ